MNTGNEYKNWSEILSAQDADWEGYHTEEIDEVLKQCHEDYLIDSFNDDNAFLLSIEPADRPDELLTFQTLDEAVDWINDETWSNGRRSEIFYSVRNKELTVVHSQYGDD